MSLRPAVHTPSYYTLDVTYPRATLDLGVCVSFWILCRPDTVDPAWEKSKECRIRGGTGNDLTVKHSLHCPATVVPTAAVER